jgi:type I restriction enzyme S subunit
MRTEWQTLPIGEIGKVVTGKTPSTAVDHYYGGEYPFYTPSDMDGRKRLESTKRSLSTEGIDSIRGSIIEADAVMVSCIGSDMGKVAIAANKGATNQQINAISVSQGFDPEYIYYELSTRKDELQMLATGGSAQPILNKGHFCQIEICVPPLPEQKAIAHILGTLDDKIELSRKTNETLEAMAKALFKSWFVDFDPVRAKAEGRPTGLPDEISDLFPDSFEDSELGEIPSGWEIALLGDHIDLIKGRSYKSDELNPSTTALVTLKSFHRNGGYRPDGLKGFTGEYKEQQVVKPGELVIALTDVTQAAEVIGRPAIVKSDSQWSTLVASLDVGIVRPKATGCLSTPYLYFLMLVPRYVQHILGYTSGTTVLHLAKDGASNFPLPIGSLPLLNHFAQLADSILRQVDASARQSELLAKTRDTLLPKLISGELRIPDAEKMLEEVGV